MILRAIAERLKRRSKDDYKGQHFEALLRHRSLIADWAVKPSVRRLSGDECPCRVMVLSAVGVSRRMMVSEAPAS